MHGVTPIESIVTVVTEGQNFDQALFSFLTIDHADFRGFDH